MHDAVRLYFSERAIPLIYMGEPQPHPVLTLENYLKWYWLYAVMPDGSVRRVNFEEYCDKVNLPTHWYDHIPAPRLMGAVAAVLGMELDLQAAEMALGRFHAEIKDEDL